MSIIDPQSLSSRLTSLIIFFLSLIFLIAGHGVYNSKHLGDISPGDDMGGDGNWVELMLLGFVRSFPSPSSLLTLAAKN